MGEVEVFDGVLFDWQSFQLKLKWKSQFIESNGFFFFICYSITIENCYFIKRQYFCAK